MAVLSSPFFSFSALIECSFFQTGHGSYCNGFIAGATSPVIAFLFFAYIKQIFSNQSELLGLLVQVRALQLSATPHPSNVVCWMVHLAASTLAKRLQAAHLLCNGDVFFF
jgi:hypothetical protein